MGGIAVQTKPTSEESRYTLHLRRWLPSAVALLIPTAVIGATLFSQADYGGQREGDLPNEKPAAAAPQSIAQADDAARQQARAENAERVGNDIRKLSQHFLDRRGTDPWIFIPEENIKELSVAEHPGLVTIWEQGKGKDIKGVLGAPIKITDYPLPWEFHLGLVQNSLATKGLSEKQINYAIGLNVALTFSDPSTWPKERTRQPPQTHSAQLLVVHLGNQGENYRLGVPQVKRSELNFHDHSPEVYLVYGRGDLATNVNGNWKMGYTWVGPDPADSGTWSKAGGPADHFLRFRVSLLKYAQH
jgi:hypothetical protein